MKLRLYLLRKLRAFKARAFQRKTKSIVAASDHSIVDKGSNGFRSKSTIHLTQDNNRHLTSSLIDASKSERTSRKKRKSSARLSQVVASLGCGHTVPLRLRKDRHKSQVYSEEEDRLHAPPPAAGFGGMTQGLHRKGQHLLRRVDEGEYSSKEGCLDQHAIRKRWVGACRCIQDVSSVDRGSTRSDEALLSRKIKKELRDHGERQADAHPVTSPCPENKGLMIKTLNHSYVQNASIKEPWMVSESKQMHFTLVEGSMSDRIVVDQKRVDTEAKTLQRWSSASVRDYLNLKGDSMLATSIGSISCSKERPLRTSPDERFRNTSFERRRPHSITSVSTLSSYDFDRASHWGSYDATNAPFNLTNTGLLWQGDIMETSNVHPSTRRNSPRLAFSMQDPDASVTLYTLSDREIDEEEHGLLHTISYASPWVNQNTYADDDGENDDGAGGDDDDDEYADCFIDLEANAKAWATARALSSSDAMRLKDMSSYEGRSYMEKQDYVNSAHRSQRGLEAAALKRKYHKEFAGKRQSIVVSSHHEDNMNTFTFPPMSDHEDEMGVESFKIFDYTAAKGSLCKVDQEGFMIGSKKVSMCADEGRSYHSLAVEKKSRNPYADFRDSMVDMVLERQIYKASELEELLQSFLRLNSLEHHDLIVQAFSEVWEKVFGSINNGLHKRP